MFKEKGAHRREQFAANRRERQEMTRQSLEGGGKGWEQAEGEGAVGWKDTCPLNQDDKREIQLWTGGRGKHLRLSGLTAVTQGAWG